jgi:Fe2+ or Zn2+ uptake regulation protein
MLLILIINKSGGYESQMRVRDKGQGEVSMKSRNTKQKELLSSELDRMHGFFNAEEFHAVAKRKIPHIGIATVYRFLNERTADRKLHSYICDKRTVYSNSKNNHCHYICQKCGKKQHVDIKNIDSIKRSIKGTICHFQIDVYGICEECEKKNK